MRKLNFRKCIKREENGGELKVEVNLQSISCTVFSVALQLGGSGRMLGGLFHWCWERGVVVEGCGALAKGAFRGFR